MAVARSTAGWTVTGASATLASAVNFATCGSGTGATITYFGVGTASTGAGTLLYAGPITPNIVIPASTTGVTPQLTTSTTITEA